MGQIVKCSMKDASDGKRKDMEGLNLEVGKGIVGSAYEGQDETLQVTLMDQEAQDQGKIHQADGFCITRFKENLLLSGLDFPGFKPGDRLQVGQGILEVTLAGKKCYPNCPVFLREGNCGLDGQAAFAKVVENGFAAAGDEAKKLGEDV